jgi:DNA-binding transcriptional ArsR family regulator|tara:strand:+ start:4670 stop:4987 length:318 start_codon:yes stop_codon:yes gene_type:complete
MDEVFRALAGKSRRQILDLLFVEDGQTLGQLTEDLDMSRQAGTKHLKILEAAGLIVVGWQGREKRHYLNAVPIRSIYERWVSKFAEGPTAALTKIKKQLEGDSDD